MWIDETLTAAMVVDVASLLASDKLFCCLEGSCKLLSRPRPFTASSRLSVLVHVPHIPFLSHGQDIAESRGSMLKVLHKGWRCPLEVEGASDDEGVSLGVG